MEENIQKVRPDVEGKSLVITDSHAFSLNQSLFYLITKRIIDVIGASIGLILAAPICIVLSFFYFFGENKGPLIYGQKRIGQYGKEIKVYKFRSMIVNAEQILKNDKDLYKKYVQNNYKLEQEEDPRITKFGRFIRKTSLDEIPQLVNVLKGEMSLVGPRPVIQEELIEYERRLNEFLAVKPGVTGYWQICGRSEVGYPERADLEFYYIDNQSMALDFTIAFKTILLVLNKKGAY